jgi:hypothetical protein
MVQTYLIMMQLIGCVKSVNDLTKDQVGLYIVDSDTTSYFSGVWFWHCHLDRHMTWGMAAVFIVKNGGTAETSIRKPPPHLPPCKVPLRSWLQNSDGSNEKENQSILM